MLRVCGAAHTNYVEGDLKLYVGEAKKIGKHVYFYDGTNLYRLTSGLYGFSVKVKYAKAVGVDDQDFFLCWREETDSNTVWFDGSLADFDSEIRSFLCGLL